MTTGTGSTRACCPPPLSRYSRRTLLTLIAHPASAIDSSELPHLGDIIITLSLSCEKQIKNPLARI